MTLFQRCAFICHQYNIAILNKEIAQHAEDIVHPTIPDFLRVIPHTHFAATSMEQLYLLRMWANSNIRFKRILFYHMQKTYTSQDDKYIALINGPHYKIMDLNSTQNIKIHTPKVRTSLTNILQCIKDGATNLYHCLLSLDENEIEKNMSTLTLILAEEGIYIQPSLIEKLLTGEYYTTLQYLCVREYNMLDPDVLLDAALTSSNSSAIEEVCKILVLINKCPKFNLLHIRYVKPAKVEWCLTYFKENLPAGWLNTTIMIWSSLTNKGIHLPLLVKYPYYITVIEDYLERHIQKSITELTEPLVIDPSIRMDLFGDDIAILEEDRRKSKRNALKYIANIRRNLVHLTNTSKIAKLLDNYETYLH